MNIVTEFEQFLASKAEEFVSKKANMTIVEFRELNAVLDSCGIDFNNLPVLVELPKTNRIVSTKSKITTQNITNYIFSSLTGGNTVTMKELYKSSEAHFGGIISEVDYIKTTTGMPRLRTRIYTQVHCLIRQGRLAPFVSKDNKTYFHRARNNNQGKEQQLKATL